MEKLWTPPEKRLWTPEPRVERDVRRRPFERRFHRSRTGLWRPEETRLATPAYVSFARNAATSGSSQTVSYTPTTAGNILCGMAAANGQTGTLTFQTPSDGANTYSACAGANCTGSPGGTNYQMNAWWTTAASTAPLTVTFPWTGTANLNGFYVFEVSGANVFDNGKGATADPGASGTPATTGAFTTNYQDLVLCICASSGGGGSQGAGYTYIATDGSTGFSSEWGLFSAGSVTGLMDFGFTGDYGIIAAAFGQSSPGITVPFTAI